MLVKSSALFALVGLAAAVEFDEFFKGFYDDVMTDSQSVASSNYPADPTGVKESDWRKPSSVNANRRVKAEITGEPSVDQEAAKSTNTPVDEGFGASAASDPVPSSLVEQVVTSFVPTSISVGETGGSTIYSTWLSLSTGLELVEPPLPTPTGAERQLGVVGALYGTDYELYATPVSGFPIDGAAEYYATGAASEYPFPTGSDADYVWPSPTLDATWADFGERAAASVSATSSPAEPSTVVLTSVSVSTVVSSTTVTETSTSVSTLTSTETSTLTSTSITTEISTSTSTFTSTFSTTFTTTETSTSTSTTTATVTSLSQATVTVSAEATTDLAYPTAPIPTQAFFEASGVGSASGPTASVAFIGRFRRSPPWKPL